MARYLLFQSVMKISKHIILALSLVFAASLAFVTGCSGSGQAKAPEEVPEPNVTKDGVVTVPEASRRFIEVARVSPQMGNAILRAPARVAFRDGAVARLGAPLPGRIERVHVRTGDRVKAGDPVLTLNCPEAASIRAALATARARQNEAEAELKRTERMLAQGVGTERERRLAQTSLSAARAESARAAATAGFAGGSWGTRVVLRAPMDGTVLTHAATVGAAVDPGTGPLIEVGDPSELWIIADVFERDLYLVREGAAAQVELPSVREPLHGKVVSIGAMVEKDARTAPVRIALNEHSEALRPGMFGRARLDSPEEGLSVPTTAVLIQDGRQSVVFVKEAPGTFARRTVAIAQPVEGKVLITSGIQAGDQVVVRGALLLDGAAEQLL